MYKTKFKHWHTQCEHRTATLQLLHHSDRNQLYPERPTSSIGTRSVIR